MPKELAARLFTIPLDSLEHVQKLIGVSNSCAVLPDAHKTLALVEQG